MPQNTHSTASFSVSVYPAQALRVCNGANFGDALSVAGDLMPDDIYALSSPAALLRLSLTADAADGALSISADTGTGQPGAALHVDCCITLMNPTGQTCDVLVLVELDNHQRIAQVYALPMAPLVEKDEYSLVTITRQGARARLAEMGCTAFARGTHITMADGSQCPIENLTPGDRVLTRDDGPQAIRWVGSTTVRAVGAMAPILIAAGTLNNEHDLMLGPDHRLFIYQRNDALGAGRAEVLVRASHLVNGTTITRMDGGFVDYFQLLFDHHQIIYAEGIAAETLLLDNRTLPALPQGLAQDLAQTAHPERPHMAFEVKDSLLDIPNAAETLRRASGRRQGDT